MHAVFIKKQIKENYLEYHKSGEMRVIYLKKAFDRVTIKDAIHLLHDRELPLDLIENM